MPVPRSVIVSRGMRGICQNGNFIKQDFPVGTLSAPTVRGFAVCGRRERAAPRGGGKKEGTPAVSLPLWTPTFPLLPNLAQIADM